jgi:hypothetical protein
MKFLIFIIATILCLQTSCGILLSPPVTCAIGNLAAECLKEARR